MLAVQRQAVEVRNTNSEATQYYIIWRGGIGNKLPKPVFYLAKSTNQHDLIVFLQKLRSQISEADLQLSKLTYIVLDNHTAHKAKAVKDYVEQDERQTSHRFVLFFQLPYSSY